MNGSARPREPPARPRFALPPRFGDDPRPDPRAISGLLNPEMYGKSVKPPQPEGLWKIVAMPSSYPREYKADTGDKIYRRSVYTFWKRGLPPPQMTIFDAPNPRGLHRPPRAHQHAAAGAGADERGGVSSRPASGPRDAHRTSRGARRYRSSSQPTRRSPRNCPMQRDARGAAHSWLQGFCEASIATDSSLREALMRRPAAARASDAAELAAWTMLVNTSSTSTPPRPAS